MFIRSVTLHNFRCFSQATFALHAPIVLIEGLNGSGKTTFLEALHYACYVRSFRATTPRDIIKFDSNNFFIRLKFERTDDERAHMHELTVGFDADKKRMIKIDGKPVHAYKELMEHYRVITITEDDMQLIKEGPDIRRAFVDQAILLYNAEYMDTLRIYKEILHNRNALLGNSHVPKDMYQIWTEQLWQQATEITRQRIAFLQSLEKEVARLLQAYFLHDLTIHFVYTPKMNLHENFADFMQAHGQLYAKETTMERSLFGAHLDDVRIIFAGKKARDFASRGQQKLVILLIKLAQLHALQDLKGQAVFLLDDFLTDFDPERTAMALNALMKTNCQLIFTVPATQSLLWETLAPQGAQRISFQSE